MFYTILDARRRALLPLFREFKEDFYLAGGTSLALQIGHRDSVDFDFFSEAVLDTRKLFERMRVIFKGHSIVKIQEEQNTLTVLVDDSIKISFFTYTYTLIGQTVSDENMSLASIEDIGCMKLSAIVGRASNKDYIDLYFILQRIPLADLLHKAHEKYPELERNLILKSIIYFEDVTAEKILFKNNNDITFEEVKDGLKNEVKKLQLI